MFLGESLHTLDGKFRIVVPKRFLSEFPEDAEGRRSALVTRGFEGCLFLFPEQGFQRALERLQLEAFGGAELRKMQRLFFSNAHPTQIDNAGRMLLPERLRALANLKKDVVLVGCADRAEIWSRESWEHFNVEHGAEFDRLDSVMLGNAANPRARGVGED